MRIISIYEVFSAWRRGVELLSGGWSGGGCCFTIDRPSTLGQFIADHGPADILFRTMFGLARESKRWCRDSRQAAARYSTPSTTLGFRLPPQEDLFQLDRLTFLCTSKSILLVDTYIGLEKVEFFKNDLFIFTIFH